MTRAPALFLVLLGVASLAGCSSDTMTQTADPKPRLDTGAAADDDATVEFDSGSTPPMDSGTPTDTGTRPDTGSAPADSGLPLGPQCTELSACCAMAGALAGRCNDAVAMGDEGQCSMILGQARGFGLCLDGVDAGPPRDAGPLGPVCMEYLACCPELGAAQTICENNANRGDEGACMQQLGIARRLNRCLPMDSGVRRDSGVVMDTGTSSVADAGLLDSGMLDAGTSTVGDAGTSTTSDAG